LWPLQPYNYVRTTPTTDPNELVLIVGGADHKTGQETTEPSYERHFSQLANWAKEHWPDMGEIITSWSGQVIEPSDDLGYYGRNPSDHSNVYIGTGDSGTGMTHGTLGSRIITDLIVGRPNKWAKLYDPARLPSSKMGGGEWIKGQLNVARQYGDWLTSGDVKDIEDITVRIPY
jgi:glycine/D-amino acid oxidase-like deaminating enzyme